MEIQELEEWYGKLLRPAFGDAFRIEHDRDDFVTILLDGDREDFFFTLYGTDSVRLYWCNECFIFDACRNALTSSDTYGEIVYEGTIDEGLPELIAALVLELKDCVFAGKEERVKGRIPSGYDSVKEYVIQAETEKAFKTGYQLGNIRIQYRGTGN